MGRYVDEILQPGEQVRYSTTIHGIVYLPGLLCWLAALVCLIATRAAVGGWTLALLVASAALALVGGILAFQAWFRRWTTETDVTSMRVIHKQGFIQRRTFEMNLDKVESVDVDQSILGRIFGWGDITIRGVGEGVERLRMIRSPLQFRNHITAH
ncbi:MAG: PH domain-containing protein [Rhizobiales bacterium]|nr:PH domain-containing protein [Hyphomicrobiales bacterium]